jgi:3-oxoacyl-[acyl-carrier protein] reductase
VDVTSEATVRRLFTAICEESRRLDALVNNVGVAVMNPIALTPVESARRVMETNFIGTFLLSHAAIRLFKASGCGRIVNFSTIAVPLRLDGEAIYAASKSAVETLTRIMAREVAGFGVTCNAVGPCLIKTQLTEHLPAGRIDALLSRQAIPRWAEASDVANVIDFFLRVESRMITGQVIYLGGLG